LARRKTIEPTVYKGGFVPGNAVIVESPFNFKGVRTAIVLDKQKWCKDGIPVMLANTNEPVRYLCLLDYCGDTLKSLKNG